jgi:hypothetical protein
MKFLKINFIFYLFIILSSTIYSQTHRYSTKHKSSSGYSEGRFGITAGYTNYVLNSNVLFTKSQPGYLIGIMGTVPLMDNLEFSIGMNYVHHRMIFIGKEDLNAEPENLKFKLENLDVPFILNYNFLNLDNDMKIGVNAGFTVSFIQQYVPIDDTKENYILEPLNLQVKYLNFDQENESISINTYLPIGLSTEYHQVACNLKYNIGLSDPFRQASFYNILYKTKAKQNYFSLSFTYFFDND